MRYGLLKSLLGKFIAATDELLYCHVDRILAIDNNKGLATAIIRTISGVMLYWFIESEWTVDANQWYKILSYKILKEVKLDGHNN